MKRTFKILGTISILIIALAFLLMGPLYYIPMTREIPQTQEVVQAEELSPEEETEAQETVVVVEFFGDKVLNKVKLKGIVDKMGVGLFTSIISYLSGALSLLHIILVIGLVKSKPEKKKVEKQKKVKKVKSKNKKEVKPEPSSIKVNVPEPINTNKEENRRHNVKF